MKRLFALVFALILALVQLPATFVSTANAATQADDPEIASAISLRFVSDDAQADWDQTITYAELCAIVERMLESMGPDASLQWVQVASLAMDAPQEMTRQEGMLALFYAAQILGINQGQIDWGKLNEAIGQPWNDLSWEYPLFPDWESKAVFDGEWDNHMIAAYFASMGIQSSVSNKSLFDYDAERNSMRLADPLTRGDGAKAVLRLYESTLTLATAQRTETEWDAAFLAEASNRKLEILGSETDVQYTGTAYYVSNRGKDSNNGRSADKPWATLKKVNGAKLKAGDAVFFERGGIWRGMLKGKDGVVYSAYGEGDKPAILGSPENGADPKKWKLLKGTQNIWVFHKELTDSGLIVFNDGESWAQKTIAYWDGSQYVGDDLTDPFDVTQLADMRFFCDLSLKRREPPVYMYGSGLEGKLYLRCDQGNPGEVFGSIEFLANTKDDVCLAKAGNTTVFDNLSFRYGGNSGVTLTQDSVMQNCEVAWFGGAVLSYMAAEEGSTLADLVVRAGDGVQLSGINNIALNNYIHEIYDYAMTVETGYRGGFIPMDNNNFVGNLLENNNGGTAIVNWEREPVEGHRLGKVVVKDNIFLRSGYGWSAQPHEEFNAKIMASTIMFFDVPTVNEGILYENNVLYLAKYALINCPIPKEYWPVFSGNTYVQNANALLFDGFDQGASLRISVSAADAEQQLKKVLGDEEGKMIPPH